MRSEFIYLAAAAAIGAVACPVGAKTADEIVADVRAAEARVAAAQDRLADKCSLTDYRTLVRVTGGTNVWTAALQTALDEYEVVRIPPGRYFVDGLVNVPSNRRIEAGTAVIVLLPPTDTAFLRNVHAGTSAERPVNVAVRDENIAIVGGVWEDWRRQRCSEGGSGKAGFPGASALFYFSNAKGLSFRNMTLVHAAAFGIQVGDAEDVVCTDLALEKCHADGFHVNGGVKNVLARNVHGDVGDDLVALNFHDWPCSSANFGPGDTVLVENLRLREGSPWFRLLPGVKLHADGTKTDCPARNVVVRNVRGIREFKMYMQTRAYCVGIEKHEPAEVGWGENIFFEDIELTASPTVAPFEIGANLRNVRLKDVRVHFPEGAKDPHVVSVGPKSWVIDDTGATGLNIVTSEGTAEEKVRLEVFDPWVSCTVDGLTLANVTTTGAECREPIHCVVFDDILKDGDSSGRGHVLPLKKAWNVDEETRKMVKSEAGRGLAVAGDRLDFRLTLEKPCEDVTLSFNVDHAGPRPYSINGSSSLDLKCLDERGCVWAGTIAGKRLSETSGSVYAKAVCLGGEETLPVLTVTPAKLVVK